MEGGSAHGIVATPHGERRELAELMVMGGPTDKWRGGLWHPVGLHLWLPRNVDPSGG